MDNALALTLIQSPTHHLDFKHVKKGYTQNFRVFINSRGNKIGLYHSHKKNTSHINELINQFKQLNHHLETERGLDAKIEFPTMILDDEADYASQNTDIEGEGQRFTRI